jgi:hypothetical protein
MKRPYIFLLTLFVICPTSNAADIWHKQRGPEIDVVVEGEIVPGDFDRLKSLLRSKGPRVRIVYLYSPGGEAKEAMKIGRMLRTLEITTEAPGITIGKVKGETEIIPECRFTSPRRSENCICFSSCFLIWIAGINKEGDRLGVHRPKFRKEYYAALSSEDAKKEYEKMMKDLDVYLDEYSVPQELKEKMKTTPSHDIYIFNADQNLKGFIASYDELLTARCGAMPREQENRYYFLATKGKDRTSKNEMEELAELSTKKKEIDLCRAFHYIVMKADAFEKYFGIDYLHTSP